MKIEAKQLIPYLPHSLKVVMEGKKCNVAWMSTKYIAVIKPDGIGEYKKIKWEYAHLNIKPILRPLRDLTKEVDINGTFIPIEFLSIMNRQQYNLNDEVIVYVHDKLILDGDGIVLEFMVPEEYPFWIVQKLLEWHFDVFGLIDKGLAVDINTLKI